MFLRRDSREDDLLREKLCLLEAIQAEGRNPLSNAKGVAARKRFLATQRGQAIRKKALERRGI